MELKTGVLLRDKSICLGEIKKDIADDDMWIFEEMINGTSDEKDFIDLVEEKENVGEIDAAFRMAVFVEKYGDFIYDRDSVNVIFD